MPALQWLGRKWRTGTDDFFLSSFVFFSALTTSGTLILSRFGGWFSVDMKGCPGVPPKYERCVYALGIISCVGASFHLASALLSCRGGPFHVSKRRHVGTLLYLTTATALSCLPLSSVVLKYSLYDGFMKMCDPFSRRSLYASLLVNIVVSLLHVISLLLSFDPNGGRKWGDSEEYKMLWGRRCRLLCCCCFRPAEDDDDVFEDAAATLAAFFQGYDLVPSDIFAGMILLHDAQRRVLLERVAHVRFPPPDDGCKERVSSQARYFPLLTSQQRQCVVELRQYSRFYMAAYGCLLYLHMNLCTGLPKLCCSDPKMCCRKRANSHQGAGCFCDLTAALKVSGLAEEDIILSNWRNALFRPVFYVALDRETASIVVAIRGTLSFVDCITDVTATPEPLFIPDLANSERACANDYYVHGGIKRSAEYVLRELRESGVLEAVLHGGLNSYRLVVLGHSLGAGVAAVLSILLYATEEGVRERLRCLAYSPPGGLMSPALAHYSKDFILACFVGNDVIPRTASHTFDDLRESVLDVLESCNMSKPLIFANRCILGRRNSSAGRCEPLSSEESRAVRAQLQSKACVLPMDQRKLFPPYTLVHLRKAVVRWTPKSCCCIPCCCCSKRENVFVPTFETPDDVQTVVCSPSMFSNHFPDYVFDALEETTERLQRGELERFFDCQYYNTTNFAHPTYGATPVNGSMGVV
ncbi:lipase domain protein, putative [Trypanosoma equiperdum]|uniref:sn-1-specific diacylglycerol lipase n=2 Tax=Trypanozoon TaxID=39700 RepID=Q388N1_TRYB2|nr:uncharacterized protein Tb10.05.0120 [Trypanosoma brucei brucei TREU927]EAN78739.1 lipase domain protein, putative [Trypanosoma brucei brucei TREU927]SCU72643.1 lipase domain protein, putative [Trypanosoma equiperdum]